MSNAHVQAMLRRAEEATARAVAQTSSPAAGAALTKAVHRVTKLAERAQPRPQQSWLSHQTHPDQQSCSQLLDYPGSDAVEDGFQWTVADASLAPSGGQGEFDEAVRDASAAYREALHANGLPPATVVLLEGWLELQVVSRLVQLQAGSSLVALQAADSPTQRAVAVPGNHDVGIPAAPAEMGQRAPDTLLSASELGKALGGVSDQTVRLREKAGELFSILRPGRRRGAEYPAFQAWPGIAGEPLSRVLSALAPPGGGRASGALAYTFFTSRTELLAGLSPVEVLTGQASTTRPLSDDQRELVNAPAASRLEAVERAASTLAATDEA